MKFFNPFKPHIWQSKKTGLFYVRVINPVTFTKKYLYTYTDYYGIERTFEWRNSSNYFVKQNCSYESVDSAIDMLKLYEEYVNKKKEQQVL